MSDLSYTVIGVDPGPEPGLVALYIEAQRLVTSGVWGRGNPTAVIFDEMVSARDRDAVVWVAVEKFVFSRATSRNRHGASHETHAMAEDVAQYARGLGLKTQFLGAGNVKPWATDSRLREFGLWDGLPNGHHRDAARHALFMAQRGGILPKTVTA